MSNSPPDIWIKIWTNVDACSDFMNGPAGRRMQTERWWNGFYTLLSVATDRVGMNEPSIFSMIQNIIREYPDTQVEIVDSSKAGGVFFPGMSTFWVMTKDVQDSWNYVDNESEFKSNVIDFVGDDDKLTYLLEYMEEANSIDSIPPF